MPIEPDVWADLLAFHNPDCVHKAIEAVGVQHAPPFSHPVQAVHTGGFAPRRSPTKPPSVFGQAQPRAPAQQPGSHFHHNHASFDPAMQLAVQYAQGPG